MIRQLRYNKNFIEVIGILIIIYASAFYSITNMTQFS